MDKMNNRNVYVDIDNTITFTTGMDYESAKPRMDRIAKINKLYDEGNTITYWTARGTVTKIDWFDLTKGQLTKWGAKHHKLILGKQPYDIYIDDKSFNSENYFK
jgi:hypothetical protein